jgi:membrane associated rhomboid family serine protease
MNMQGEKFRFIALILCVICIVVFAVQNILPGFTDEYVLDASSLAAKPWILVTSIFLHGSVSHLLSNIFALGLFGSILERITGTRRFLMIFFGTGILASLASAAFYPSSLGASGAIFGVLGVLTALRPKMVVWTYGAPMPMIVAAAFWFLLDIGGAFYPSSIANMAHIAGMLAGIIIGLFMRSGKKEEKPRQEKMLSKEELDEWEDEYL